VLALFCTELDTVSENTEQQREAVTFGEQVNGNVKKRVTLLKQNLKLLSKRVNYD